MKLERLVLVNWGQLRPGNYEMGGMTLLTGETGSGKSTMLDALQTVMTAANKGIMNYNPGQEEVTQGQRRGKTKRTLESYVVGAEYNNFSRKDGAQGYMAAVFRPSKGEEHLKPFTAVVAASARVEGTAETRRAKLESLALVIVDDAALGYGDFMKDSDANECVSVDRIARHLHSKYPKVIDFNDKKMDYLCSLYGRFRGKSGVTKDEATNAARAWVQSIAYRPIGSVHELVRDEILDFDEKQLQQDIERISGLMRQVSNLRKESVRLQDNVNRLSKLQTAVDNANQAHEAHVTHAMVVAKLQLINDEEAIVLKQKQITTASGQSEEEAGKIRAWNKRLETLDQQRIQLTARLQGIPVHTQKQDLEAKMSVAVAGTKATLDELGKSLFAAALLQQRASALLEKPIPEGCQALKAAVAAVAAAYRHVDFPRLAECRGKVVEVSSAEEFNVGRLHELTHAFEGVNQGIDLLHESLIGPSDSMVIAVATEASSVIQTKLRVDDRVRDFGSQKAKLYQGKISYPHHVQRGVDLLEENFPLARAQVLCDLVEPKSETWQSAIEGYMGGARFNLIVDTAWERRCIDFLKSKGSPAKIVQGAFCLKRADASKLPADSVVHELQAANPIAWAFLVDQFGSVVKVADVETLRHTPRGVTVDGLSAASRTMFTADKTVNVFGQKARKDQLIRITADLSQAESEAAALGKTKDALDFIKSSLQGLKQPHFDAAPLRDYATQIDKTRDALANLDITELDAMEKALADMVEEIRSYKGFVQTAQRKEGELEAAARAAESAIKAIQANKVNHLMALDVQTQKFKLLVESNPALTYLALTDKVDGILAGRFFDFDSAKKELDVLASKPDHLLVDAREALNEYNSSAKPDERFSVTLQQRHDAIGFDANYAALVTMGQSVVKTLDGLKSVGLYNNSRELDTAERSFHDVFTKQFCVEIKTRVDEGIRTLRQMNAQLKNLKFGADSFSIDWSRWEPEYEEYLGFFEAVTKLSDSAEPVDLFGESELSEKHKLIRDKLVKHLLDENQESATKELLRIADYRNYRHYDIINDTASGGQVRLSEWGTGSGGQLETPAYIVRAAVVTNRLKLFEKGPSLKLLVNDESFAKMDEPRARAVLSFLRDKLDLQVISAMPTMKAGPVRDEFNREYSFTRLSPVENGELDFVSECDERIFKSDQMRELWARQRQLSRETAKQLFDLANPEEDIVTLVVE